MRERSSASLHALFASVLASVAVGPLGCHRDAPTPTSASPDRIDAGTTTESDIPPLPSSGRMPPFKCPPPFAVTPDAGLPATAAFDGAVPSWLPAEACRELCGASSPRCSVVSAGPPVSVECSRLCIGGRRPEGFRGEGSPAGGVGAWLAALAQLEAASVPAFRRVARELAGLGAPRRLVGACRRAARDEVRHARSTRRLARARGGRTGEHAASPARARSLEAIAIENAVEGCVRETYAALVATRQARLAQDPRIRVHFARVARDETDHAALAWRIDAWARAQLDGAARARVDAARRAAREELLASLAEAPGADVARAAGLPSPAEAMALAVALDRALDAANA